MAKKQQSPRITDSTHLGSIFVKEESTFVHSYELHRSEAYDTTFIKYAEGNLWDKEIQGSTAGSICDSGDIVTVNIGSNTIQLDYADMEVLTALIMACNDSEMEFRQYVVSSSLKPIK